MGLFSRIFDRTQKRTTRPEPTLREASQDDLEQLATVAAKGFPDSNVFQYQRPWSNTYPEDTLSSYRADYNEMLNDPDSLVFVVEVPTTLKKPGLSTEFSGPPCIVALASVKLHPSQRGTLAAVDLNEKGTRAPLTVNRRDQSDEALVAYANATKPAKARFLKDHMTLSTIVVHPKYRRNGYATLLVNYITRIADEDNVKLGVSASQMGKPLMKRCGFKKLHEIEVPGYRYHEKPTTLWLGSRNPRKLPNTRRNRLNQLISAPRSICDLICCLGLRQRVKLLEKSI